MNKIKEQKFDCRKAFLLQQQVNNAIWDLRDHSETMTKDEIIKELRDLANDISAIADSFEKSEDCRIK